MGGSTILNHYNLAGEKSLATNDIPKSLVLSYIYELPLGRGKKFGGNMNRGLNAIVGGWQVSGISTFKSGFPLAIEEFLTTAIALEEANVPTLLGIPTCRIRPVSNGSIRPLLNSLLRTRLATRHERCPICAARAFTTGT